MVVNGNLFGVKQQIPIVPPPPSFSMQMTPMHKTNNMVICQHCRVYAVLNLNFITIYLLLSYIWKKNKFTTPPPFVLS